MKPVLSTLVLVLGVYICLAQSKVSTNGTKYVLLEYTAGVHFPHTTDADYAIGQIRASEPRAICAAMHVSSGINTDSMANVFSHSYVSSFSAGIPSLTADRASTSVSEQFSPAVKLRTDWGTALSERLAITSTFDVTMIHTYNSANGQIIIDVTGIALTNLIGDYRFNVYVLEDSVTGGPGYDQKNFYNTQSGHPYYGAGDPIAGYTHMQVVREIRYGSTLHSNPVANTPTTETFTYTLPSGYNPDNMRLVATILGPDQVVQNCISAKLTECMEPPAVQICAASYNEDSGKTIITWNKNIPNVAAYNIYKEGTGTTPGQYMLLGSKSSFDPSYFKDIFSNPNTESSRYKLTITDSCGREKSLDSSIAAKNMLLTYSIIGSDIKLDWTIYEGAGITNAQYIMRSIDGGNYQIIDMVGGATVKTYKSPLPTGSVVKYKIQRVSTLCAQDSISSNIVTFAVGVASINSPTTNITLYPNPTTGTFNISGLSYDSKMILTDITGRMVKQWEVTEPDQLFDVSELNNGVYFIKLYTSQGLQAANLKLYRQL